MTNIFTKKYLEVTSEINDNTENKENKGNLVNHPKEEEKIINTIIKKQQL